MPSLILTAPGIVDQDDMCIWVHPSNKSQSTIITSDKAARKLFVYDLSGDVIQTISVSGRPGNIDVRYNFILSGVPVDIVGYNNRSDGLIVLFKVDPSTRTLTQVGNFNAGDWPTEIYGFCLYQSPTGKYYAIASGYSSQMRQWELVDNGDGTIVGDEKRTWSNSTGDKTEGLVADDEAAMLYAANEGVGVLKYYAEPIEQNPTGQLIILEGYNGLTHDIEGITLYYAANGEGYIIISSQGSSNFKVYDRKPPHAFIKTIEVTGVSNADGIDVSNVSLGDNFPQGIFLTHNGTSSPYPIVACKYEDLELTVDVNYWDPRISPLPVELAFFTGSLNGNTVELRWRTETEVNNYGFDIERTKDNSNWLTIGYVEGHGNSNSPKQYNFIDTDINQSGTYYYRLKQIDNDGTYEYSDIATVEVGVPNNFYLSQNYPNPFNPETRIDFTLPEKQQVSLRVYNTLGELVKELVNGRREAGSYSEIFNASNLPSGVYIYRLRATDFTESKKMTLIK